MTDKRHFVDPSICCAALSLTPERLLEDLHGMGLLFESLAVRDLRVYAEALEGEVFQYHDANGLEADAVMQLFDGRYALFEVKMSSSEHIEEIDVCVHYHPKGCKQPPHSRRTWFA